MQKPQPVFTDAHLEQLFAPKPIVYRLADVKHLLVKVAFDVVRFRDGNPEELWEITSDKDGSYIVARYNEEAASDTTKTATASTNPWDVAVDDNTATIHIFYRQYPVAKLAAHSLGLSCDDLPTVKSFLPKKLATDLKLRKALLSTLSNTERTVFLRNHPELIEGTVK
jgi:hypothetical protein